MSLLKLAFASTAAYAFYRYAKRQPESPRAAFAVGESTPGPGEVRNAGPEAMHSDPPHWDHIDQASDESYPASDAPATHRYT
ncbi:MAG: hypothetical protein ABIM50_03285 [Novosphingobium sp.]